jgi:outer membrane protein assembly factor BamB
VNRSSHTRRQVTLPRGLAAAPLLVLLLLAGSLAACGSDFSAVSLMPFAESQFLATSLSEATIEHVAKGEQPEQGETVYSDRIYCLDATGETRWSFALDGYIPLGIATSPAVQRAAVAATSQPAADGSRILRILLVDAESGDADVKVLREFQTVAGTQAEVDLARDGRSVALILTPGGSSTDADAPTGDASAEVMDTEGKTIWKLPVPAGKFLRSWAMDESLSTAVLTMVEQTGNEQSAEVVICRPSFVETLPFTPPPAAEVSPDGRMIALGTDNSPLPGETQTPLSTRSTRISLYALDAELELVWTADAVSGGIFNAAGTMLVSAYSWGTSTTAADGSTREEGGSTVQVLSASNGSMLWERTNTAGSQWSAAMRRFAPAFVYSQEHPAEGPPQSAYLIDLTGAKPELETLAPTTAWFAVPSYDAGAVLGIDGDGTLVPVPIL